MKNSLIVLFALGIVNFSCTNSTSSVKPEKISLPLKLGNSWTYNVVSTYYSDSQVITRQESDITFTVLNDTIVDGMRWFYIESGIRHLDIHKAGYYSTQNDGIYFLRSFDDVFKQSISSEIPSLALSDINTKENASSIEKRDVFLHNPDTDVPDRLLKTENAVASVSYQGETISDKFNDLTHSYTLNYYQISVGTRAFALKPFDLHISVSNKLGFTVYESAFFSTNSSTEEDPRLKVSSKFRFELVKFKTN